MPTSGSHPCSQQSVRSGSRRRSATILFTLPPACLTLRLLSASARMSASAVLSNFDLVSVWAAYLSISDLFRASCVSSTFCSLLSSDRVWSPLLSSALALSTVPPPPPSQTPLPLLSVPVPPTAIASRLCRDALTAHLREVAALNGRRKSSCPAVTVIAIRRLPSSLSYHMRAALRSVGSTANLSAGADQIDCRSYELHSDAAILLATWLCKSAHTIPSRVCSELSCCWQYYGHCITIILPCH